MKLAIDLGGTNVRIGLVDKGTVVRKIAEPCPSDLPCEEGIRYIISLIEKVMSPSVKGIGVGVPSVVDAKRGIVYNVANIPSWIEVPLKDILEEKFHVPAYINNDCNCFVLGEKLFGEGIPFNDIIGVTTGTGVGSGLIIGGQLYCGNNTGAGEIGSLPYLSYDFEHYCSSGFFTRYYNISAKEAHEKAKAGDARALDIWNTFGTHFGNMVKAILFAYDPEAIILGGGITSAFSFFEKRMNETIATFPYPETVNRLQILISREEDISLLGTSALVV